MADHELSLKKTRKTMLLELGRVLAQYVIDMANKSQPFTRDSIIFQAKIQYRRYNIEVPEDVRFSDG